VSPASTPFTPPMSIQSGQTVSSPGTGMGTGNVGPTPFGVNPNTPGSVTRTSANGTIEDLLINLITNTVAPNSWSSVGGPGTIQYYPLGMALVVNQTQEV